RGDAPFVAEGVLDLAVAIAPEGVHRLHHRRGTRLDGLLEGSVRILHIKVESHWSSAQGKGALADALPLAAEHDGRVTDADLGVHDALAVRARHAEGLFSAEGLLVEL